MVGVKPSKIVQPVKIGKPRKHASIRESQKKLTRDRLINAATDLFREVSFRDVTINQIMDRAEVSRSTFYLYFKDKLDIATAAARRRSSSQHIRLFEELASYEEPSVSDIRRWIDKRLAITGKDPVLVSVFNEVISSEPNFAREYGTYLEHLADVVMKKTYTHLDPVRRKIVRSNMIFLMMTLDRFASQLQHQKLEFAQRLSLNALAEMFWLTIFSEQRAKAPMDAKRRSARMRT